MNGPTVMLFVFAVAGSLVFALVAWERDRDERQRRRWELDGIGEWEQLKRDLAPRSLS